MLTLITDSIHFMPTTLILAVFVSPTGDDTTGDRAGVSNAGVSGLAQAELDGTDA